MEVTLRAESRTGRLARLLDAWRYDRTRMTAEDIEWLLGRALDAQQAGLSICKQCARDVDDPLAELCWYCVRNAEFLGGGEVLRPLDQADA
jgi:hypothetical protein